MKTAEQIAEQTLDHWLTNLADTRSVTQIIAQAIEADRAQRAADLQVLANAASHWATELTEYVIDGSREAGDAESAEAQEVERDAIQAVLGRYLGGVA
ncbi:MULTISPECIES: hypothetical protein [unclassified Microbacterium]|uniref:hypothetical protein n=1 Tax=unclassified Microbacterium TaxID=2609290 RepID=UPI000EAA764F|nr:MULTISPECIES: hypothetical protein [unclassified Microbacterium]MBT2484799.1 hypothetical protein [Microbacterium sp. ISL-108]RKN67673.1 hypothetical protein D7252_08800 [Microbacterium sp. CGR2]